MRDRDSLRKRRTQKKEKTCIQITEKEQNGNKISMRKGDIKRTIEKD